MLPPLSAPAVFGNDVCHKRVCTTSHLCCSAVDTALDGILGPDQPAKPQTGRKRLGETANAHDAVAIRQRVEARWHFALKREIAIHIILYNQEVVASGQFNDLMAARFRQRAAR